MLRSSKTGSAPAVITTASHSGFGVIAMVKASAQESDTACNTGRNPNLVIFNCTWVVDTVRENCPDESVEHPRLDPIKLTNADTTGSPVEASTILPVMVRCDWSPIQASIKAIKQTILFMVAFS